MKKFIATAAICMLPFSANAFSIDNSAAKQLYDQAIALNNNTILMLAAYAVEMDYEEALIDAANAVSGEVDPDDIVIPEFDTPEVTANSEKTDVYIPGSSYYTDIVTNLSNAYSEKGYTAEQLANAIYGYWDISGANVTLNSTTHPDFTYNKPANTEIYHMVIQMVDPADESKGWGLARYRSDLGYDGATLYETLPSIGNTDGAFTAGDGWLYGENMIEDGTGAAIFETAEDVVNALANINWEVNNVPIEEIVLTTFEIGEVIGQTYVEIDPQFSHHELNIEIGGKSIYTKTISKSMHKDLNSNILNIINEVAEAAYEVGYVDGYKDGYAAGYADGFADGVASVQAELQ